MADPAPVPADKLPELVKRYDAETAVVEQKLTRTRRHMSKVGEVVTNSVAQVFAREKRHAEKMAKTAEQAFLDQKEELDRRRKQINNQLSSTSSD